MTDPTTSATLRAPTSLDVATIAGWHPMPSAEVLGWLQPDYVRPWVMVCGDAELIAYGELWVDDEEDEVELALLIVARSCVVAASASSSGALMAKAAETGLTTTIAVGRPRQRRRDRLLSRLRTRAARRRGGGGLERGPAARVVLDAAADVRMCA